MTPTEFGDALRTYCQALGASVTSWGRTERHNKAVGGVAGSAHRFWVGGDVVYDGTPPDAATRQQYASRLGLRLIAEGDHDHLQPVAWPPG